MRYAILFVAGLVALTTAAPTPKNHPVSLSFPNWITKSNNTQFTLAFASAIAGFESRDLHRENAIGIFKRDFDDGVNDEVFKRAVNQTSYSNDEDSDDDDDGNQEEKSPPDDSGRIKSGNEQQIENAEQYFRTLFGSSRSKNATEIQREAKREFKKIFGHKFDVDPKNFTQVLSGSKENIDALKSFFESQNSQYKNATHREFNRLENATILEFDHVEKSSISASNASRIPDHLIAFLEEIKKFNQSDSLILKFRQRIDRFIIKSQELNSAANFTQNEANATENFKYRLYARAADQGADPFGGHEEERRNSTKTGKPLFSDRWWHWWSIW